MDKLTRAQQAQRTKNLIFETALRLFQEGNYDKVTINRICKEANVSVGNFYHYFKSKEEVLMEKYIEFDSWLDDLDFSQNVEKVILDIIDLQTHLTTSGKYVSPERKPNKYL